MVIPNNLLVHAAPLRQCGTCSELPATKHDENANSSSLGRTGFCVERFLASLFRCSRAYAKSESAIHLSLAVINRTNVLKFRLQLRPFQRDLLQWCFHLLPGFMLRHTCLRTVIILLQPPSVNSELQIQLRFSDNTTLEVMHHTQRHLHEPEHAGSQRELLTICRDRHHAQLSDA